MEDQITKQLAGALREVVRALTVHPRFRVQETNSYAIASQCDDALRVPLSYIFDERAIDLLRYVGSFMGPQRSLRLLVVDPAVIVAGVEDDGDAR